MRIATRLWLALLATILLVLSAGVMIRVREEQSLLLEVTLRDRRFFAHALQNALKRDHGSHDPLAEARALLATEEIVEAHIVTSLVEIGTSDFGLPRPRLSSKELAPLQQGEIVVGVFGDELLTYVPLQPVGRVAIELVEPHAIDTLVERVGYRNAWMQALALVGLAGVVTFVIVQGLVGRPLARLAFLARQIGSGDLSARAKVPRGKHEVAVLAREMNRMVERLHEARVALEELDAERVTALEQLRHADRLRTVGQLASTLAHELGTPLNVVSGHARLIEQEAGVPVEAVTSAREILEQSTRMTRILKDLLGFARRRGTRKETRELRSLAIDAARTIEPLARKHRVSIFVEREGAGVRVTADPQQFMQVLTNLLTNAMHAMPEGGEVRIMVDELTAEPPTGIHARSGHYARVTVIDSGVGIDPEDIPHLFEAFFTRKPESEGTGLGLAVVEGIVREHEGWVEVHSERGQGSRFEVFLPPAPADLAPQVELGTSA
jgi:two-component system NtrC family sensor kinase